jgi:hypothetical protein
MMRFRLAVRCGRGALSPRRHADRAAWLQVVAVCLLLVAGPALAKDKAPPKLSTKQSENLMGNVKGTFDMAHQSRPYIVFLILDQVGNRHPSF